MRAIKVMFAMLLSIAVAACDGGGYGGDGNMGGSSGYSISGTVSGGSTNNSGVMIRLTGAATKNMTTLPGGSYSFTGLANGSYMVTPTLIGYAFAPSSALVTVYNSNISNINFVEAP